MHIIDTAGLRDSQDIIESEGIKRAIKNSRSRLNSFVTDDHIKSKVAISDLKRDYPRIL